MKKYFLSVLLALEAFTFSSAQNLHAVIDKKAIEVSPQVIEWRRYIHQHPELSNREYNTSQLVADYLKSLGLEVQTGIAHTGVIGILKGGKPGPCIALREDMDALPIKEITNVPFASTTRGLLVTDSVWVMHACGHDAHTAMLLGAATVLSSMKKDIAGTVKFIFQSAEEGPPPGEEGGASMMIKEGVMENPHVDVMFGMHMEPKLEIGTIGYKPGAFHASSDWFTVTVKGKGTHGAEPWKGIDPIVVSAQIINSLQTIASRQENLAKAPLVVTVGKINGGTRNNIIPDKVTMEGTLRALDDSMRIDAQRRISKMCANIAAASGATAEVKWKEVAPVQYNDPVVQQTLPSLQAAAGANHVQLINWTTTAEDFGYYGAKAPTFYFFFGGLTKGKDPNSVSATHTPDFYIDDSMLYVGVKAFCYLVVDYGGKKK